MTVCWVFAAIVLGAGALACFVGDLRRAVLALWVAGLGVGAIYLTLGAEVLAIVQWIVSTLVAISFIFFSAMFGEYGPGEGLRLDRGLVKAGLGVAVGAAFAWVVWSGTFGVPEDLVGHPAEGTDIAALGRSLTREHLLSLEVLALTLFLVLVGGGVIARPDAESAEGGAEP